MDRIESQTGFLSASGLFRIYIEYQIVEWSVYSDLSTEDIQRKSRKMNSGRFFLSWKVLFCVFYLTYHIDISKFMMKRQVNKQID